MSEMSKRPSVSIIIPVYNERENIGALLEDRKSVV